MRNRSMHGSARSAFTLVEMMIVIAILVTIAGVMAPVIVRSKDAARGANDISNLRQLGVAAALYAEAYGSLPGGCPTLVDAKMVRAELCAGMLDPFREGLANRWCSLVGGGNMGYQARMVKYRNSFLGRRETGWEGDGWERALENAEGVGWLVDLAPSDSIPEVEPAMNLWAGRYRRLLVDGSVQWRVHKSVSSSSSGPGGFQIWSPIMLFGDFSDQWIRDFNSEFVK